MLEIKHVTKVYKAKGGVETRALDDVSISFGETGLVFLLGKSGSGKSTLLNVCGGLDEPTGGEVIVKGKSSKDFSGSDFDSYRNTFVGFIFQEYNVLDEFNVEDNIALALELQGKPKDKEKIAALLKDVELESFAKRKPNTLSGGQKQRIAIARALVKDPQIIMADEPTGALDSATGKQVFDTLKKLSETRLVIVVSHDREFAEIYGDRIVELKDGKIISDVTKTEVPPKALDENVTVIGGTTLSIKSGSRLSSQNIKAIQDFVLSSDGDVIITKGEKEISTFKKANRMTDAGSTETFNDTDTESIVLKEYTREDSKFIRSRLPSAKAFKIGASGLKLKPIRLIFTILLSFVAFTMFGLFSTLMLYDGDKVTVNSFMNSDYEYLNLSKSYCYKETWTDGNNTWSNENMIKTKFTDKEIEEFAKSHGDAFGYYAQSYGSFEIDNVNVKGKSEYYKKAISKFAYVPANHKLRSGITGNYPTKPDEICISSYLVEVMKKDNSDVLEVTVDKDNKPVTKESKLNINSAQDIIGKYIIISLNNNRVAFKVTGVFESGTVSSKYDSLKEASAGNDNWMLSMQYEQYLAEGMLQLALVSEDFYETYSRAFDNGGMGMYKSYFDNCNDNLQYKCDWYEYDSNTQEYVPSKNDQIGSLSNSVRAYGGEDQLKTHFFGGANKTSLGDKEIVVGLDGLSSMMAYPIQKYFNEQLKAGAYDSDDGWVFPSAPLDESDVTTVEGWDGTRTYYEQKYTDEYGNENSIYGETYEIYLSVYNQRFGEQANEFIKRLYEKFCRNVDMYTYGRYYNNGEEVYLTNAERLQAFDEIVAVLNNVEPVELEITINETRTVTCTVVGFHESDISSDNYYDSSRGMYLSQNFIDSYLEVFKNATSTIETNYVEEEGAVYNGIFVSYDKSEKAISSILDIIGVDNKTDKDVVYDLESTIYNSISMANGMAETLSTVFLIVGIVFAVFSALLMFNFISVSISSKRKEIGILRAVGARGTDVFKIFFSEAGIITGICTVLAIVGAFFGCGLINSILKAEVGLDITLFVFGFTSIGIMIGIALVVAFISTFLPVFFAARKKPVDSIRAL